MTQYINLEDKIFVAGHLGMVGSAICRSLNKKGYNNLLLANKQDLDLRNSLEVNKWFAAKKPDIVILAAAKVGGILANKTCPADFIFDNLKIQINTIEASWKNGVKRFLFLGSSCIYPKFAVQPIKEESLLSGPLESTNESYAIAKIAGINKCKALKNQYDFDAISLMPTNLYGPGDNYNLENSHVLPALIRRYQEAVKLKSKSVTCWGTGSPLREFLHVDDLGEAAVFVLEQWQPTKDEVQFLNVGTGLDISIKELAGIISSIIGFNGETLWDATKPDGTPKKQLDVSRINQLGWKAKIGLREGLKETIKDFQRNNFRT